MTQPHPAAGQTRHAPVTARRVTTLALFGAPRVLRDGAPLRLPVKKSLALLAYLALEGRATRAKLAALFWGEADAEAARRNLRRELHRLREADLGDLVRADDDHLSLAAHVQCDARDLLQQLDSESAALPDWPGTLMDGFDLAEAAAFDAWLASRRDELLRRWTAAAQRAARAHEQAGRAQAAAALHLRLVELDPMQESHYAEAMRVLYLAGERGRALELYERCRRTLHDELGLDPLPATAALAERIRAAERLAPIVAQGDGRELARFDASLVGLIGRETELAALRGCATPLALIEGEPGIGKSRLAAEYALDHRPLLHLRGSAVWRGAPMHAVSDLLQRALDDPALRAVLLALPAEDRAQLARLLPALSVAPDAAPGVAQAADTSPPARAQFFAALTRSLDALLGDGVLVADDVQWLDEATLEALEALARRAGAASLAATAPMVVKAATAPTASSATASSSAAAAPASPAGHQQHAAGAKVNHAATATAAAPPGHAATPPRADARHSEPPPRPAARIVFTARSVELTQSPAAREMLRRLQRAGLLTPLLLAPLDERGTLQLVRELSGTAGGQRFAGRLQRATGGNPFFMLETIRYLFDIGELRVGPGGEWSTPYDADTADYAELPVPPTVQKAVAERIERLGPAARRLLETAALAGDSFTLAELRPATALAERDAADALERALQAQLLMPAHDAYRFVHDLGRAAVEGEVRPERRRLIHRRLAATLQERRGAPERIGQHLEAAGERSEAVAWRMRAAQDAERRFARTEVIAHLQAALADLDAGADGGGTQGVEVRLALIKARRALGPQALAENAAEFEAIDATLATLAALATPATRAEQATPDLELLRMRTDMARTMHLMDSGRHDDALRLIEQVLAQPAAGQAPPQDQCRALYIATHCAAFGGNAPLAVRYGERGRALALTHDAPELISIETALTYAYVATDRAEEAVALADLALARLARRPPEQPVFRANLLAAAADAHMASSRYASAQAMLEQALDLLKQSNMGAHIQMPALIALALLHAKTGNLTAAKAARSNLLEAVGDDQSLRVQYMTAMVDASIELLEGKTDDALLSLGRAVDASVVAGNSTYQLNALLMRARVRADLGDLDAACADADKAAEAVNAAHAGSSSGGSGPVLIHEALHACREIARGDLAAAQARLRVALASERFVDDHMHESKRLARALLAEAMAPGQDLLRATNTLNSNTESAIANADTRRLQSGPTRLALRLTHSRR